MVNVKKTKEMVVDFNKKVIIVPPSNVNGEVVERVSTYTYLGVEIDNKLTFKNVHKIRPKNCRRGCFFIGN